MSNKSNFNGPVPLEKPPVRMPDWWDEFVSRFAEISPENEVDHQVADPIHEKGLD